MAAALTALALLACGRGTEPVLPTARAVEARYRYEGELQAELNGNVVELRVYQPAEHLRRGGELWAKVGPYIVLFSEETRDLFAAYPGVAAVRAITLTPGAREIARAMLLRDTLNELTWRRALNIAGRARLEGTDRPSLLDALVRWGEDYTEFRYSPSYVRR